MANDDQVKVSVQAVGKVFTSKARRVEALAAIDLDVRDGEFLCLLGPSGCGKTTLLRIMAELESPSSGRIEMRHDDPDRPLSSVVFQDYSVFPWKTIMDNVVFPLLQNGYRRREAREVARHWLGQLDLAGFEKSFPDTVSGGMKQRVAIARALALRPELLLMDEPLAALDAQLRLLLQEKLLDLWQHNQNTVVFVTHSIDEALLLGDRIAVMSARPGRIDTVIDVPFARPRDPDEIRASPDFAALRDDIWHRLRRELQVS
ncbi:ABC transporter ATP-binding protein [Actinophytocola xinjiangensis]|uniref:ABC transporter ATP-binding protein n=1 Tax=Actinophytocola xinjiangensis TaxID=485602 RepID=UPI001FEBEE53|nr:ABC transporter ATP-binding protein [Actinophytocola xinjiangensis]